MITNSSLNALLDLGNNGFFKALFMFEEYSKLLSVYLFFCGFVVVTTNSYKFIVIIFGI